MKKIRFADVATTVGVTSIVAAILTRVIVGMTVSYSIELTMYWSTISVALLAIVLNIIALFRDKKSWLKRCVLIVIASVIAPSMWVEQWFVGASFF